MAEEPEPEPDRDRAQDRISQRKNERAHATEAILADVEDRLGDVEYPVSGEELATEYGLDAIDLPNETESMGSVFDRLANEEFDSVAEAREVIYGEITGDAGRRTEANPERDIERLDEERRGNLDEAEADRS